MHCTRGSLCSAPVLSGKEGSRRSARIVSEMGEPREIFGECSGSFRSDRQAKIASFGKEQISFMIRGGSTLHADLNLESSRRCT
jgi:hypothetical protein